MDPPYAFANNLGGCNTQPTQSIVDHATSSHEETMGYLGSNPWGWIGQPCCPFTSLELDHLSKR